jgi:thiol-disulfide isomerase/thioredoxin
MIKKQFFICFILLVCLIPRITSAQTNEILVGHKMPEVKFDNILNYTKTGAKLSDFEGKLLILDFWATYCAPCITMFGKTDSLEKAFQGKVKFLSVTKEPEGKVKPFLDRLYRAKKITPTSVVKDTLLSKYFYYSSIPYYVWINEKGKVIATTDASEITFANIQSVLKGLPTTFQNRTDIRRKPIDNIKSLFVVNDNFILKDST